MGSLWSVIIAFSCLATIAALSSALNVDVAVLGMGQPYSLGNLPYLMPSLKVAADYSRPTYTNSLNITFFKLLVDEFYVRSCSEFEFNQVRIVSEWYYTQRRPESQTVSVVLITGCTQSAPLNQLFMPLNQFFLGTASFDSTFTQRAEYPTYIAASFSVFSDFHSFCSDVLLKFHWTSIFIIHDVRSAGSQFFFSKGLQDDHLVTPSNTARFLRVDSANALDFDGIFRQLIPVSRVIWIFANGNVVRQFMLKAATANLTNGDYVFFANEPLQDSVPLFGSYNWFRPEDSDEKNAVALEAYRVLIVFHPAPRVNFSDPQTRNIFSEIQRYAKEDYNFSFPLDGRVQLLGAAFSALSVVLQTASEVSRDPTNNLNDGTLLANAFLNRTFATPLGSVSFDSKGVRHVVYSAAFYAPDGTTQLFGERDAVTGRTALVDIASSWPSGHWPPPNMPRCGYDGLLAVCTSNSSNFMSLTVGVTAALVVLVSLAAARLAWTRLHTSAIMWRLDSQHLIELGRSWNATYDLRHLSHSSSLATRDAPSY